MEKLFFKKPLLRILSIGLIIPCSTVSCDKDQESMGIVKNDFPGGKKITPGNDNRIEIDNNNIFFKKLENSNISYNYYVDSNSGNDRNDGLTDTTAWANLSKINSIEFKPGTAIHFKRGSVFRGKIDVRNGVTYDDYGKGAKPLFLGSVNKNLLSDWKTEGSNIWSSNDSAFKVDVGNIIFNNGEDVGGKVFKEKEVNTDKRFWYDKKKNLIKLYSVRNPAQRWSHIECALSEGIIAMRDVKNVVIKNFELRYTGAHAVSLQNTKNVIIKNLDISYIGGSNLFAIIKRPGIQRFGNGIEIYGSGSNILIESNKVNHIYDAALTNQSFKKRGYQANIIYRNNRVTNTEYCFEIWYYEPKSTMKNVLFEKNICQGSGKGWGHKQRPDGVNGRNIMVFSNTAATSNVIIRNNTFYKATESNIRFANPADEKKFHVYDNKLLD